MSLTVWKREHSIFDHIIVQYKVLSNRIFPLNKAGFHKDST